MRYNPHLKQEHYLYTKYYLPNIVTMEAINIKAYTSNIAQVEAIKAFMKALKIKYELSEQAENPIMKLLQQK